MLKVNDKCQIDISFDGFDGLVRQNFISLVIVEDGRGIVPPQFEIQLRQMDRSLNKTVSRRGLPITVSYGASFDNVETHEFQLINKYYEEDGDGFILHLSGLLSCRAFTNNIDILAIDGTSDEVFNSLTTVKPLVSYTGNDKQVWIRHNNSEKNFAERVLFHSYISDDDLVVAAHTVGNELIVKSAKEALKSDPVVTFGEASLNTNPDLIRYDQYIPESDNAIFPQFLSEGRTLTVVSLEDRNPRILTPSIGSVYDGSVYTESDQNLSFPPVLDSGNTHENYHQAWLNNLSHSAQFLMENITIDSSYRYIPNSLLKLLDPVEFLPSNPSNDSFVSQAAGMYLVAMKTTAITQIGFLSSFLLGRDFHVQ